MTNPKPSIQIPVDLTNPCQFFACCDLLELADRLWPGALGWFASGSLSKRDRDDGFNPHRRSTSDSDSPNTCHRAKHFS